MKNNYEHCDLFDVVNLEEVRKEKERQEKAKKREQRMAKFKDGVMSFLAVGVPAIVAVVGAVKSVNRTASAKQEKETKEIYCYDRSLGHYWELERKLSNSDWLEINHRRDHGEKLADILADMRVLKK